MAANRKSSFWAITIPTGGLLVGALLGYWALTAVFIPHVGLGEVERIRQLGLHIHETVKERPTRLIVALGDSVTREGLDTTLAQTPDARFENWAVSGCSLAEQRIQLSLVLRARPDVIVFALSPASLCHLQDLPLDKAYAYAYAGFNEASAWNRQLPEQLLSTDALNALASSRTRQIWHFRTAPKSWLNQTLRAAAQGSPAQPVANWQAPHYMTRSVSGSRLDWHLDLVESWWTANREDHVTTGEVVLDQIARVTREAGCQPVFALTPVHPELRSAAQTAWKQTRNAIDRVAARHRVAVLDATERLNHEQFADALHPNRLGRETYSRFLSDQLAPKLAALPRQDLYQAERRR